MTSNNLARHARRKRQTRLTFDSAEPSSSAGLTPAKVRYQASTSTKKKDFDLTSQPQPLLDDDEPVFSSGKKFAVVIETPPKLQKRDGRLPFQPASSPLEKPIRAFAYDEVDSSEGSSPEDDDMPPPRKAARKSTPVMIDSDSDGLLASPPRAEHKHGKVIYTPEKNSLGMDSKSSTKSLKNPTARSFLKGGSTYSAPVIGRTSSAPKLNHRSKASGSRITPSNTPTNRKRSKPIELSSDSSTSDSDENEDGSGFPTPHPTQSSGGHKNKQGMVEDSESDYPTVSKQRYNQRPEEAVVDNEEDFLSSSQDSERARQAKATTTADATDDDDELPEVADIAASSKRKQSTNVPIMQTLSDDTDYEEEEPISSPIKRRKRMVNLHDSDDDDPPSSAKRSRLGPRRTDSEDDEVDFHAARKGKGKVKEPPPKRVTRQEQQRNRRPHRTKQEKAMELGKRRRAGEKITELTPSGSSEDDAQRGIYDSDSEVQVLSDFEDEEESEEVDEIEKVRESLRLSNRNNYDDDFVVDDDGPIGVPNISIPLQFTHAAHKHLKEHFKDVVEWLVQKKLNPLFNQDDEVYQQAFKKLDDEVHGYASSKFTSSVWQQKFQRALWARPGIWFEALGLTDREGLEGADKCGACNRSHPTTWKIQFTEHAYYKSNLEEVDNDHSDEEDEEQSDDSEDSDSSKSDHSRNSQGQSIPPQSKIWYVGRFCKANAEIAHSLIHWKHALNCWVLGRLEEDGHLSPTKLAEREGWKTKRKGKFALTVVDGWEAKGEIKKLYRAFKLVLETARSKKTDRWHT